MSSQETFSITTLQRMCARSEYLDESDMEISYITKLKSRLRQEMNFLFPFK